MAKRTPLWRRTLARTADLIGEPALLIDTYAAKVAHVNGAFCACVGFTTEELVGGMASDASWWPGPPAFSGFMDALPRDGLVQQSRLALRHKDGRVVVLAARAARIGPGGSHVQIVGQASLAPGPDRAEREAVFQHVPVGLALTRSGRFVQVNPAFALIFGWQPSELAGQPGRVVWPSDAAYEDIGRRVAPALKRGELFEIEPVDGIARDGAARVLRVMAVAMSPQRGVDGGTLWICEDVGERTRLAREMNEARRHAEAASQAKSQFLANMSHELRTPLNAILGLARLLQQDPSIAEEPARHIGLIAAGAESLAAVVSDILDLSKIEAGRVTLEVAPFYLHELLRSVHASFSVLATSRDLMFTLEIASDVPHVVDGDAHRVRQILANLVNNALKFTAIGGVRIALLRLADGRLRFEVHDTGPGFDDSVRDRLFQPFSQADDSTTRRYGGTGLGLSICRELANLMDGSVGAVARPGQGSMFWLELPLPPSSSDPVVSDFGELDVAALCSVRVLVVEDNPVNLLICTTLLERRGASVVQATDGMEAIRALEAAAKQNAPIDVVLMDLQMPVLGGIDATRRLRERWSAVELPVIGLSAAAFTSERDQALGAGMDDFIVKPLEPRRIERAIMRALTRRRNQA